MALRLLYNNLLRIDSFLRIIYKYTLLVYTQCLTNIVHKVNYAPFTHQVAHTSSLSFRWFRVKCAKRERAGYI
jgi:hypothetical protein